MLIARHAIATVTHRLRLAAGAMSSHRGLLRSGPAAVDARDALPRRVRGRRAHERGRRFCAQPLVAHNYYDDNNLTPQRNGRPALSRGGTACLARRGGRGAPGPGRNGCAATVAAHPGFGLGPVDLVVEALAGLPAEDRGAERDCERRHEGDDPASGQRPAVDGKPREVQRVEHVVLRAADGRQGGDGDGDEDSPQPDADTLPGAVETRPKPGDVAAAEGAEGAHAE